MSGSALNHSGLRDHLRTKMCMWNENSLIYQHNDEIKNKGRSLYTFDFIKIRVGFD